MSEPVRGRLAQEQPLARSAAPGGRRTGLAGLYAASFPRGCAGSSGPHRSRASTRSLTLHLVGLLGLEHCADVFGCVGNRLGKNLAAQFLLRMLYAIGHRWLLCLSLLAVGWFDLDLLNLHG